MRHKIKEKNLLRLSTWLFLVLLLWPQAAPGGDIADYFYRIHGDPWDHGNYISEIGIEHTACYGTCPEYCFVIRGVQGDGSFDYVGYEFTDRLGRYTGTVDLNALAEAVKAIQDNGFMSLKDEYSCNVTDHPSVFTMVVMGGKTKIIHDYANQGPAKLHKIEILIDNLMKTAKWKPFKEKFGQETSRRKNRNKK